MVFKCKLIRNLTRLEFQTFIFLPQENTLTKLKFEQDLIKIAILYLPSLLRKVSNKIFGSTYTSDDMQSFE